MGKTLKWIGPGYFGEDVAPGGDMPDIDKKRLEKFIKLGKVGTIAEAIDIEKVKSDKIKGLEKENVGFVKKITRIEKENSALKNKVSDFEKEIADADLVKVSKKKDK